MGVIYCILRFLRTRGIVTAQYGGVLYGVFSVYCRAHFYTTTSYNSIQVHVGDDKRERGRGKWMMMMMGERGAHGEGKGGGSEGGREREREVRCVCGLMVRRNECSGAIFGAVSC